VSEPGSNRAALAAVLAFGIVAASLAGCGQVAGSNDDGKVSSGGERTSSQEKCRPGAPIDTIVSDPPYINDEELIGFADNVFVGRMIKQLGHEPPSENTPPLPQTLFAVKVEKNIKGSLSGTVVVVQDGGCDPRYGRIVLVNDDDLLRTGQEVVFSTKKQSPAGPHLIVGSNYGDIRVGTEEEKAKVISRLKNDKKELVPFDRSNREL
jgi:hypothetical protein